MSTPQRPVVLLVEDDEPVRDMLARLLDVHGFEVVAAATGEEGLARESERRIDLLLSDVMLPGQNGFQVAAQILRRSPHVRVLFMSGYINQAIAHGADFDLGTMLLEKPFVIGELLARVRAFFPGVLPID